MNIGGGEAADQLVRMMLASGEVAVRLSGSALKNVLALTLALARDHKKIYGKVNLGRMLRETRDLRQFPMTRSNTGNSTSWPSVRNCCTPPSVTEMAGDG